MKKKVLITINPDIIKMRQFTTMRKFIRVMDQHFDLMVLPLDGYDFKRGLVRAYRRINGGRFRSLGLIEPRGDLWMVYSDGYYLNHGLCGFRLRRDYFNAQIAFHEKQLRDGRVALMVNTPEAETRTLKSWFATLDFEKTRVIPTYTFCNIDDVHDFQKKEKAIVVKPVWGGAATEVQLLSGEQSVRSFDRKLKRRLDRDLSDYCFQLLCRGPEKRLWFAGGKFITGRKYGGKGVPWSGWTDPCPLTAYNKPSHKDFDRDVAAARKMTELSGISVGSVDFIGDRINEVNGAGTVMTEVNGGRIFTDARPAIVNYLLALTRSL
ncbi:MAG: hypothetical protein QOJ64_3518 [Acidobacteriota bacterium]|jgi:hypothetical protein|nr:hypothetical protein [Acidobacteriota bacterium]